MRHLPSQQIEPAQYPSTELISKAGKVDIGDYERTVAAADFTHP